MKVLIRISGQISGNNTLVNKMYNFINSTKGMFNSYILYYSSIKEAKTDIQKAYKSLCNDMPEIKDKFGGIRKLKDNTSLYYDASQACIEKIN